MSLSFAEEMANPEEYLPSAPRTPDKAPDDNESQSSIQTVENFQERVNQVLSYLVTRGFNFEPWQVASFITAVRTKPFVILAGISGTGKTKLPRLIADATGAECLIVPVRPDWSDSSDLLGYERIDGTFQPGPLLRFAQRAIEQPETQFFFVLDEMNIARVEYYLAEVLSHLEDRHQDENGRVVSGPFMPNVSVGNSPIDWSKIYLPENLCIVGSVNMDETTFGFSKKVLDRAFVIEFSTIDLSAIGQITSIPNPDHWSSEVWRPAAISLASHLSRASDSVRQIIEVLTRVNTVLQQAQLQFGYRVRDEVALFCLAAQECIESFTTSDSGTVDPLDLAIAMKVLPRIQGSGDAVRRVLEGLNTWASPNTRGTTDEPGVGDNVSFSFCSERLTLMLRRLSLSGFTSYWL